MSGRLKTLKCRVCNAKVSVRLTLKGMPQRVQTLLTPENISSETSVVLCIGQCTGCGLIQLIEPSVITEYDEEDYCWSVAFSPQHQKNLKGLASRLVNEYGLAGRKVLEIGGGDGYFAQLLQDLSCRVTLLDPAPKACELARKRGLTNVIQSNLETALFSGEVFDAVIARHVLEHIRNPVDFLKLAHGHVNSEALVIVEVPNVDPTIACGRFQDFCAEHLSYFSPSTLAYVIQRAGFIVDTIFAIEKGEFLIGVGRAINLDLVKMADDLVAFRENLRNLILEAIASSRRVGIFGAGTRGVALLAMVNAGDMGLAYVVDSDPKKWKRFTPITHLPVVSPEYLAANPVDDLLISTTAYQEEIMEQLNWFFVPGRRFGLLEPEPHWIEP